MFKSLPGREIKTIDMSIVLEQDHDSSLSKYDKRSLLHTLLVLFLRCGTWSFKTENPELTCFTRFRSLAFLRDTDGV